MSPRKIAPRIEGTGHTAEWWREQLRLITLRSGPRAALDAASEWLAGLDRDCVRLRAGQKRPGPARADAGRRRKGAA